MRPDASDESLAAVLERFNEIRFAVIFGSAAAEKMMPISDIDIGIYTEPEVGLLRLGQIIYELEGLTERRIDLVELNGLTRKKPKLAYNITACHRVLVNKDLQLYIKFKAESYRFYFDIKPMLDRTSAIIKQKAINGEL